MTLYRPHMCVSICTHTPQEYLNCGSIVHLYVLSSEYIKMNIPQKYRNYGNIEYNTDIYIYTCICIYILHVYIYIYGNGDAGFLSSTVATPQRAGAEGRLLELGRVILTPREERPWPEAPRADARSPDRLSSLFSTFCPLQDGFSIYGLRDDFVFKNPGILSPPG